MSALPPPNSLPWVVSAVRADWSDPMFSNITATAPLIIWNGSRIDKSAAGTWTLTSASAPYCYVIATLSDGSTVVTNTDGLVRYQQYLAARQPAYGK